MSVVSVRVDTGEYMVGVDSGPTFLSLSYTIYIPTGVTPTVYIKVYPSLPILWKKVYYSYL